MKKTHRPITVVALLLGLFMGAMEMTVVSTAMPTVVADLGGIDVYDWVFTAYMLASTVTVPIHGKLADLYGRKPVMLFGIVTFLLGSILCGQARSMTQLIAFRTLQGLGAGAMQPMAMTVIGDIFDLEERGRMQGLFGAMWGLAGIIGPVLGGVIVDALSWRWVFYVNVPFGFLAMFFLVIGLHENIEKKPHKLDLWGALTLTVTVVALLSGARGSHPWVAFPLAAGALALFLWIEMRAPEPLLPIGLFARPVLAVSSAAGALVGGAMFPMVTFIPLFVQGLLHGTPTEAGSAITPMLFAWPVASTITGRLVPKVGFRPLVRAGFAIAALGTLGLALFLDRDAPLLVPQIATAIFGMGMGFANTALILAVQTSVKWEERGVATASTMFFRTIGGSLAVAAVGGVIAAKLARDPAIPHEAANEMLGPHHGRGLDPAVLAHLEGSLADGLSLAFWVVAGIALLALAVSLLFPKISAAEARGGGVVAVD